MLGPIEVREAPAQPCLIVRGVCEQSAIGEFLSSVYPKLFGYAAAKGATPGAPFARYPDWREDDCDIEAGITLDAPTEGSEEIEASALGGCRVARATHTGSYEGLSGAHEAVMAYVEGKGLSLSGAPYEVYLDDCNLVPVDQVRTVVCWPVA